MEEKDTALAYYSYKDVENSKFMSGNLLPNKSHGCIVTNGIYMGPLCPDAVLLHYFGEEFDDVTGEGADMDDINKISKSSSTA
jgi:ATP-dependent DNA helicase RecQ